MKTSLQAVDIGAFKLTERLFRSRIQTGTTPDEQLFHLSN